MTAEPVVTGLLVSGMTCAHCVASVREELAEVPGVESVEVDLVVGGASRVTVASRGPLEPSAVRAAIDEAGYELVEEAR
jgi:copper chaperone